MIASLLALAMAAAAAPAPVVATTEGPIVGQRLPDGSVAFRGVPYAQPPVGALRWAPPRPIRWSTPRDATIPGTPCPQRVYGDWNRADAAAGREDCLTLELRTPSLGGGALRPVLVWIHGGSNRAGSGVGIVDTRLGGRGVVLVSINYRLGILGFLSHRALSAEVRPHASGNYGLMDQQAALRWVRDNVARFGGDPARVTIAGESAGAQDVGLHLLVPGSRGLFAGAILESGTPDFGVPPRTLADAEALGDGLVRAAGAPADADAATLRRLPVAALLAAADRAEVPGLGDPSFIWLQMTVDGVVLPRTPAALMAARRDTVPMIIGTNATEFTTADVAADAIGALRRRYPGRATAIAAAYGLGGRHRPTAADALAISTDLTFRCPAERFAIARMRQGAPVWVYRYDTPGTDGAPPVHASELDAVLARGRGGAARMQDYWLGFVRRGDPNAPGLPHWPEYGRGRTRMVFGREVAAPSGTRPNAVCSPTRRPDRRLRPPPS